MPKSTEKTLTYVGIGVLGFYLLSKMDLGGKIGGGIGDVLGDALNEVIKTITETVTTTLTTVAGGLGNAAGNLGTAIIWDIPSKIGTSYLTPFVNLFAGKGEGERLTGEGNAAIDQFGLLSAVNLSLPWNHNALKEALTPGATWVDPSTGYISSFGRTYLSLEGQTKAAQLEALRVDHPTWNEADIALAWTLASGKSITNWNTSLLSVGFKSEAGIT